jgi:hypothetical protein
MPASRRNAKQLGVYSGKLQVPYDAFAAGIGDYKIVTTLLSRRQGTDAAINGDGAIETVRSKRHFLRILSRSTKLSKLTISSARGVTAF